MQSGILIFIVFPAWKLLDSCKFSSDRGLLRTILVIVLRIKEIDSAYFYFLSYELSLLRLNIQLLLLIDPASFMLRRYSQLSRSKYRINYIP